MQLDQTALDQLFVKSRTAHGFLPKPVPEELLRQVYDLARMGPTSMNCQPARYVFIRASQEKERLMPALMEGNRQQTKEAPVTVIVATDTRFYEKMPKIWHDPSAVNLFSDRPAFAAETALRNGTLGGAYLLMAARALGLDCGPMSGFNAKKVQALFLQDTHWEPNFLINLGFADTSKCYPRNERLSFEEACILL